MASGSHPKRPPFAQSKNANAIAARSQLYAHRVLPALAGRHVSEEAPEGRPERLGLQQEP